MNSINADLHCHSVISDGTLTPEALALRAQKNGVQLWALTDHDELGGQIRAQNAARDIGLSYLCGVEVSVSLMGQTIHIVGLGVDPQNQILIDGLRRTRDGRSLRGMSMAEQLTQAGIEGAYEGALKFASNPELLSRTHFARFLVEQGICKSTDEVFRKYLVEGKPGYVDHVWATLQNAIDWILQAGGAAVIAHPGRYRLTDLQMQELFRLFKELGGQGIEIVTGSHSPAQYAEYAKIAQKYDFLGSRGSDFHDPKESRTDLGQLPPLPAEITPVWTLFQ